MMAAVPAQTERTALVRSIACTAVLGVIGVGWGLAVGSQMIVLDGVYAAIGILVSWLLLRASVLVARGPSDHYPYGREALTPLVIGVQGFVLLATLTYAAIGAVSTIAAGGSEVTAGWAVGYAVLSALASLGFWWWLRGVSGSSDLLTAEATAWAVSALFGIGMVLGFSGMWALEGSRFDAAAAYVDPAMVLIASALFAPAPLRMVRTTFVELLERAPSAQIQAPVHAAIAEVCAAWSLGVLEVRMTKVGPKLYVEVDGTVAPEVTVAREHAIRTDLERRLADLPYEVWLNLELWPSGDDGPVAEPLPGS